MFVKEKHKHKEKHLKLGLKSVAGTSVMPLILEIKIEKSTKLVSCKESFARQKRQFTYANTQIQK